MQASTHVFFHESLVQLLQRVDIALVVREECDVVFKLGDAHVPEVEVFAQILQDFRLDANLGLFERHHLLKQGLAEL